MPDPTARPSSRRRDPSSERVADVARRMCETLGMSVVLFRRTSDGRLRRAGVAPEGQASPQVLDPEEQPVVARALETGQPVILDVDASSVYDATRVLFVPWTDQAGAAGACVVIGSGRGSRDAPPLEHLMRVIPERLSAELDASRLEGRIAALEQTESAFRALVEVTSDPVKVVDLDGRVRMWNAACEALYGYSAQEVMGQVLPFKPAEERTAGIAGIRSMAALGAVREQDVTGVRKDGSMFTASAVGIPLHNAAGNPTGVLTIIRGVNTDSRYEQMQSDFLAVVTRELKDPLTAILGYTQMLSRPEFRDDAKKRAKTARALEVRTAELASAIDDLLLASRIERAGLALSRAVTDVSALVTEAVSRFGQTEHGPRIAAAVEPRALLANVDGRRISQAVHYLLRNAVEHSPGTEEVRVEVRRDGDVASIVVLDHGEGIPAGHLDRVFDRFYKVPSDGRDPGMGLGLYLVRSIAEAHGGTVTVVSKAGKGSTFTMRIPLTT